MKLNMMLLIYVFSTVYYGTTNTLLTARPPTPHPLPADVIHSF
jgi:hypothetical protein